MASADGKRQARVMTIATAAEMTGRSKWMVHGMISAGHLKGVKRVNAAGEESMMVDADSVDRWLAGGAAEAA